MSEKADYHPLPGLGQILTYAEATPPHEVLVMFFEKWWSLREQPQGGEYALLYRALSELLPRIEWPKEEFKWWVNKYDCALITKYATFKKLYLDRFGPIFDAGAFIREYEAGQGEAYVKACSKKEQKAKTEAAVVQAKADNPEATQEQIAKKVGLKSQGHVSEIIAEISVKSEPKLLNHGDNQHTACDNNNRLKERGTDPEYIKAKLKRDGHDDLAAKVEIGEVSARQAGIQMGWIRPKVSVTIGTTAATDAKRILDKLGEDYTNELNATLGHLLGL